MEVEVQTFRKETRIGSSRSTTSTVGGITSSNAPSIHTYLEDPDTSNVHRDYSHDLSNCGLPRQTNHLQGCTTFDQHNSDAYWQVNSYQGVANPVNSTTWRLPCFPVPCMLPAILD